MGGFECKEQGWAIDQHEMSVHVILYMKTYVNT